MANLDLKKLNGFINFLNKLEDSPGAAAGNARKIAEYFGLDTADLSGQEAGLKAEVAFGEFEEQLDALVARAQEKGIELPETFDQEKLLDKANIGLGHWSTEAVKPSGTGSANTVRESTLEGGGKTAGFHVDQAASTTKTRTGEAAVRSRIENMLDKADDATRTTLEQALPDIRKRLVASLPKELQARALSYIENEGLAPYLEGLKTHIEGQVEKPTGYKGYLDKIKGVLKDLEAVETSTGNQDEALKRFASRLSATSSGPLGAASEIGQMVTNSRQKVRDFGLAAVTAAVGGSGTPPPTPPADTPAPGATPGGPPPSDPQATAPVTPTEGPAKPSTGTPNKPGPGKTGKMLNWFKNNFIGDEKQRKAMGALMEGGISQEQLRGALRKGVNTVTSASEKSGSLATALNAKGIGKQIARGQLKGQVGRNLMTAGTSPLALMLLSFAPQLLTGMIKGAASPFLPTDQQRDIEASGATDPMAQYLQKRVQQDQILQSLGQDPATHEDFHQEYSKAYGQQVARMQDVPGRRYYGSAEPALTPLDLLGLAKLRGGQP